MSADLGELWVNMVTNLCPIFIFVQTATVILLEQLMRFVTNSLVNACASRTTLVNDVTDVNQASMDIPAARVSFFMQKNVASRKA